MKMTVYEVFDKIKAHEGTPLFKISEGGGLFDILEDLAPNSQGSNTVFHARYVEDIECLSSRDEVISSLSRFIKQGMPKGLSGFNVKRDVINSADLFVIEDCDDYYTVSFEKMIGDSPLFKMTEIIL